MSKWPIAAMILAVALGAPACSGRVSDATDGETASAGDASDPLGCLTDPRAQTYAAEMTQAGKAGLFRFVLMGSAPAPPALDTNTWVIAVEDPQGNSIPGAILTSVTPWMPDHGHGTSAPTIATNPDGTITVSELYFFMVGLWQTTLVAEAGGKTDSAMFSFCVGE